MPIYEYKCNRKEGSCGKVITELRPISKRNDPIMIDCDNPENGCGACPGKPIMSATPTTFRFNDRTGFKRLDKQRGS